jgi:hypothetical protein
MSDLLPIISAVHLLSPLSFLLNAAHLMNRKIWGFSGELYRMSELFTTSLYNRFNSLIKSLFGINFSLLSFFPPSFFRIVIDELHSQLHRQ